MSKLDLSEIKTEFSECKSMKQVNIKKKIKQANLGHQNTTIIYTKAHTPNHNEDKNMSDQPTKIDFNVLADENDINKCDKNNINNDPIKTCKPLKRLISSLKYYQTLDVTNNKDHQNIFA
eukprot:322756_1